jgi:hypothetical protein
MSRVRIKLLAVAVAALLGVLAGSCPATAQTGCLGGLCQIRQTAPAAPSAPATTVAAPQRRGIFPGRRHLLAPVGQRTRSACK